MYVANNAYQLSVTDTPLRQLILTLDLALTILTTINPTNLIVNPDFSLLLHRQYVFRNQKQNIHRYQSSNCVPVLKYAILLITDKHDVIQKTGSTHRITTSPDEDRATATGNMHKNLVKIGHVALDYWRYPRGQTDRHT